jgi:hypothetical protein
MLAPDPDPTKHEGAMKRLVPFAVAALVSIAAAADAQTQSQDEHSAHHPAEAAPAAPGAPAGRMPRGQMQGGQMQPGHMGMGGDMGRMMPMMHGGMMGGTPTRFVEGRLAFLKTELKVTPAQEPQWTKFADAYRSVAQSTKGMDSHMGMMGGDAPLPERLTLYEQHLTARIDAVRTIKAAVEPLYAVLSADQKKVADELMGHIGMM